MFWKRWFKKTIAVGDKAPDFELLSETRTPIRLSDVLKKNKWVVLYFYPKDDTYGCIAESCDFRDRYSVFTAANVEILGVSSDSLESHVQFREKYQLPFPLLSDADNHVRDLYGVKSTMGMIPGRVTFIIDPQGTVQHLFNSQFNPHSHVIEALKAIPATHSYAL